MDSPYLAEDADGTACRRLETLIRDHLEAVMNDYQVQPLQPPNQQPSDDQSRTFLIESMIIILQQRKDVVLALLLRATINVQNDDIDENDMAVGDFLERAVNTLKLGGTEWIAYLQSILEGILQRDQQESDMASSTSSTPLDTSSGITISFGNKTEEIPFHKILSCFWGTRLNTQCEACLQPIVCGPPIRTISQHRPPLHSTSIAHIRVRNRHFSCLDGTLFVPVSHVWDDSIRRANDDETKSHHEDAASTIIRTLEALFHGAEDAYSPGVEFWHDYFTVPQWESSTKESLLLYLPAIYHRAEEILVHISDVPPIYLSLLLIGNLTGRAVQLIDVLQKIPLLIALCGSEWMQRMWVTLEYSQCKAACILNQANHIWRSPESFGWFSRDTFTQLVSGAHDQLNGIYPYEKTLADRLSHSGGFLGGLAARKERDFKMCLGEIMELVAKKDCYVPRDRFLAIQAILNSDASPENPVSVPNLQEDACASVWYNALCKDDYSPLLLQPRENVPCSNPGPELSSWMVGYQGLAGARWDLGDEKSQPRQPSITPQSSVQGESSQLTVRVDLEFVGVLERIHYLDVEDSGDVSGVEWTIGILNAVTKVAPAAETLVDVLNCVFPFDKMHMIMARIHENMALTFTEIQQRDGQLHIQLSEQIKAYRDAPDGEPGRNQRLQVAQEISDMLQLEKNIAKDYATVTRLTLSRHLAQKRKDQGARHGEPICQVRCHSCSRVALFRLDLRETGREGNKIYRIPGLGYAETVENGVGLVLDEGRITGRMLYGAPACDCKVPEPEKVEIF